MKKNGKLKRVIAALLAVVMVAGYLPAATIAAEANSDAVYTVADPQTVSRPGALYGDNTQNAGKVTLDKTVVASDADGNLSMSINGQTIQGTDPDNFLIAITQYAQVMGLTSESAVPLDVVFVLDTSGSMNQQGGPDRASSMVTAVNTTIAQLMAANEENRVAVVAFSSSGYGGGSSDNVAANVLSSLKHYTGESATQHLRWMNNDGETTGNRRNYIGGRDRDGYNNYARRNGHDGGTNIQAGIIAGAQVLMDAQNDPTVTVNGKTVTRMPFIVLLSDGQPTFSNSNSTWYDPSSTGEQGPGSGNAVGNGFLPAITAAYYKSLITEKYYGTNASESNRCNIYTIGVEVSNNDLAEITLDPAKHFVEGSTNDYYDGADQDHDFHTYWSNFIEANPDDFRTYVGVRNNNGSGYYTFSRESILATRDRINGKSSTGSTMYAGGLQYNDGYFAASSTDEITNAFKEVVSAIQLKAISIPTKVTEIGGDFSGYVTFYDTIGEYMEVKDMKGILADGNFYQGRTFTQLLLSGSDSRFNETLTRVLETRLDMSESSVSAATLIAEARANKTAMNDTSNSFCWWGKEHDVGEEDIAMQLLASAKDDSIEFIENNAAPSGATHICRSYFFYGTAGSTVENPNHDYLYFVVRVQRSLTAPYQQTVVISAPASLLAMEKVSVTEDADGNYTAKIVEGSPAHVVYEVGLRSDITAQNVSQIVSASYAQQAPVDNKGSVNYDPATDTYYFFANDWDRTQTLDSHQRAMAKATFDAAADNEYYTYTEDTLILTKSGDNYVPYNGAKPAAGQTFYRERTYFDWSNGTRNEDGSYNCVKKTVYVPIAVPNSQTIDNHLAQDASGNWYIKAGTYTASTLVHSGDDVYKADNTTETAATVKHVYNTSDLANSHYTVLFGNNGRLALKSEITKTVSGQHTSADGSIVTLTDGSTVVIGDELTYTVKVVNSKDVAANATVTDRVPAGTAFVSADNDGSYDPETGIVTWNIQNIPADQHVNVSMTVRVTEEILDETFISVDNAAHVSIENGPSYTTNTTHNPPSGKSVEGATENVNPENGVQVGDALIYRIRYSNDTATAADVTITDIIPAGTHYLEGTASHGGVLKDGVLTWVIPNVQPGRSGVVTFRVVVDASAKNDVKNDATIRVGKNDPGVKTNPTETRVKTGALELSKTVTVPEGYNEAAARQDKNFTLLVREIAGDLDGIYGITGAEGYDHVIFEAGRAYMANAQGKKLSETEGLTIRHGWTLKIAGLPANANFSVSEVHAPGYTASVSGDLLGNGSVNVPADSVGKVSFTNAYSTSAVRFQLSGTKTISGTRPGPLTFTFTSQACDANGAVAEGATTVTANVTVPAADSSADFSFSPRSFSNPGVYRYLVSEFVSGATGVTYDPTQYLLTVTVTDDGQGVLTARSSLQFRQGTSGDFAPYRVDGEDAKTVLFANVYKPQETQLVLEGTKYLANRALKDAEFSFEVRDESGKLVTTGQNVGNEIVFKPITYTEDLTGTHTYTITEVNGRLPGVTYDPSRITVTVDVTDVDGKLVASATYPEDGVVFRNTYVPTMVSASLGAEKVLTGERTELKAGEFSFVVTDGEGNTVASGSNDASGKVAFSAIGYTLEMLEGEASKTFTYTITEILPDLSKDPFIEYSKLNYTAVVTVRYDSDNGTLTVDAPVYKLDGNVISDEHPVFTNVVNKDYVTFAPGPLQKETKGENIPAEATFSFSVKDLNGNVVGTGIGQANGQVVFSALAFTAPGTYSYWIQEANSGVAGNGITYDTARFLWTVEVGYDAALCELVILGETYFGIDSEEADPNDPNSYTTVADPEIIQFHNEYLAQGMASVTAKKQLQGRPLFDGEFDFQLVRDDDTARVIYGTLKADSTTADDGDGNVTFGNLYYTNEDFNEGETETTVFYTMTEVKPKSNAIAGMEYDTKAYYVGVKLTLDGENVHTEVTYYSNPEHTQVVDVPVFENTYTAQETSTTIEISKKLTGRDLKANEFSFQLIRLMNDGTERVVETATNTAEGKVRFIRNYYATTFPSELLSHSVRYLIREVPGGLLGVDYSAQVFGVEVFVSNDVTQGKLVVTDVKYYSGSDFATEITREDVVFTNVYEAEDTSYTPVANKVLTGRPMTDNEFSFLVQSFDLAAGTVGDTVSTGLSKADGSIQFTAIGYPDRPGSNKTVDMVYRISEVVGNLGGISYTDTVYYLNVAVLDDGQGKISVTPTYYTGYDAETKTLTGLVEPDQVIFSNTYTVEQSSVQFEGTKVLTGRDLVDGEFDFVVREGEQIIAYGTNDASGNIVFGTITYTVEGQHTYTVTELTPSNAHDAGITVGGETFRVEVSVVDDGQGNLIAAVTYPDGKPEFHNTYSPDPVEVQLEGWKQLLNKNLQDGEFTFQLKQGESVLQTVTNDAQGLVDFETLTFTKPGTYTYTVTEIGATQPVSASGTYLNDESVYTVTIVVTDDLTGKLNADVTYRKGEESVQSIEFLNSYTPKEITKDLSVQIGASKTVESVVNYVLKGGEFHFAVTDVSGKPVSTGTNGASNDAGIASIDFAPFTFQTAGIYVYRISEDSSDLPAAVTADSREWDLRIHVRYNEDTGELYIEDADITVTSLDNTAEKPAFVNEYAPEPVSVTISALKRLAGRPMANGEFLFRLMDGGVVRDEVRNGGEGTIYFNLHYDAPGVYNYSIIEVDEGMPGITYSDNVEYVTVTVTDTDLDGKLEARVSYGDDSQVFDNGYSSDQGSAVIEIQKIATDFTLKENDFAFELLDETGKVIATVQNDANGKAVFQLSYTDEQVGITDEKLFTYTVCEVKGAIPGIVYDENEYTVTVYVKDDYSGKLKTTVTYPEDQTFLVFENKYEIQGSCSVTVDGSKTYTDESGKALPVAEGQFSFGLYEGDKLVGEAVKNDANGKFSFTLTYDKTQIGTHSYTVKEIPGSAGYIDFDTTVYNVEVTVADNGKGGLEASYTVNGKADSAIAFANKYVLTGEATLRIEGSKTYTDESGKALPITEGQFSFGLYEGNKLVGEAVKNDANGKFSFTLTYDKTQIGTHSYTVKEIPGTDPLVSYDDKAYAVKVTVADNGKGGLDVSYTVDGKAGTKITFTNTELDCDPVNVTIDIQKNIVNKTQPGIGADGFVIVLDKNGTKSYATTDEKGKAGFTLTFGKEDIGKSFQVKVFESKGHIGGVIYDKTTHVLNIQVDVNSDGTLKVLINDQETTSAKLEFTNIYDMVAPPPTGDTKDMIPHLLMMLLSAAGILLLLVPAKKVRYKGKYVK